MIDACFQAYIQPLGHAFCQCYQAAVIVPFRVGILLRVAFGDVSRAVEDPDGFADVDEVVDVKALGDKGGAKG